MKISIRKGSFETNSSSMHSLVITNKKNQKNDYCKRKKEIENWGFYYSDKPVIDKENKVYFLAALFEYDNHYDKVMSREYNIFLKILEDNNEEELLKNLQQNAKQFKENGCRFCSNYFDNDVLIDCDCKFPKEFFNYFGVVSDEEMYQKLYDFIYGDGVIVPYEYM